MPIKKTLERLPGGMMIVPLLVGALLATLAPGTGTFFGSFTGALFSGSLPILAVFYVCLGATIPIQALPRGLRRGGVLLAGKIITGLLLGIAFGQLWGEKPLTSGFFSGLSTLAIVAAMNDTNGGLYLALMQKYGKPEDASAYTLMSLESGPFLTMLTLGLAGLAAFPWQTLVGGLLPLAIGIALGNLDRDLRSFFGGAAPVMIPFFAFALGTTLDLHRVAQAGMLGILLGIAVVLISGTVLWTLDRLNGGSGTAGLAAATTAGNAAAVPALVATANPAYADAAGPATILVASSVIVTALLAPLLTVWWAPRSGRTDA